MPTGDTFTLMRRAGFRVLTSFLACAAAMGGCARPRAGDAPRVIDGTWEFTASTGESVPLRGTLVILDGTYALRPSFGSCRIDTASPSMQRTRFLCDNTSTVERLAFVIDHDAPLTRSTWTGVVRQSRERTVCTQYITQNNRQVCVASRKETVITTAPLSGPLSFRPRPAE